MKKGKEKLFKIMSTMALVPSCGQTEPCTFMDIFVLIRNINQQMLETLLIPMAVLSVSLAGANFLGNALGWGSIDKGKNILSNVAEGLALALGAWIIVSFLAGFIVSDSFNPLK